LVVAVEVVVAVVEVAVVAQQRHPLVHTTQKHSAMLKPDSPIRKGHPRKHRECGGKEGQLPMTGRRRPVALGPPED
jgi:hypothetical protein